MTRYRQPVIGFGQPAAGTTVTARPSAVRTLRLADLAGPRARHAFPTRRIDHHLLLLTTAGHGTHMVDFVEYRCRPGTLLWARPTQMVRYSTDPGLDAILITWPAKYLPELPIAPSAPDDPFGPVYWQLTGEDQDAVIDEVSQLVVDCARYRRGELSAELLRQQLATLVLRILLVPPADPYRGTSTEIETFLRFRRAVEAGYARSRQVAEYAAELGCSVRTLTRACLAVVGRSAKQVVDERVALEAKRLLASTDLPVTVIGERLGFSGPTHFCRLFHRAVGCPPGKFRTRNRSRPSVAGTLSAQPGTPNSHVQQGKHRQTEVGGPGRTLP